LNSNKQSDLLKLSYMLLEFKILNKDFKSDISIRFLILLTACTIFNIQASTLSADELRAHPRAIVFNAVQGHPLSDRHSIFIFSTLETTMTWTRTKDVSWLTTDLSNGVSDSQSILEIGVNTSGMSSGIYLGHITLVSAQSDADPVIISVSLIINPDVPVQITTWKDGYSSAMSVSIDDGQSSAFDELQANGFKGTYVTNGTVPPSFYTDYYNAGMELGSHLVNHPCATRIDDILINQEILPNIQGIYTYTPEPVKDIISLVWPCGYTNYREQADATEYFLSARGYNINQLEDATPDNFMNLKSYNSHEHAPYPPADLKTVVDDAVNQKKWFNLVLHNHTNDDGAITYAHSKDIWVTSIGTVIKYILQRDRFILTDYNEISDRITFNVSRLQIPASGSKNFEDAFHPEDLSTLQIDIDDSRTIAQVLIGGSINSYQIKDLDGNKVLFVNVKLEPTNTKSIEIDFQNQSAYNLIISGVTSNSKVYDGTTAASLNTGGATLKGILTGDDVTLISVGATGTFVNKNVGTNKSVTTSGFTLGGTDSGKYTLIQPTPSANIIKAGLTVTGVTANHKVYNGTIVATLNTGSATLEGVIGGDVVSLVSTGASGTFANMNVGTGISVSITGLTLGGADGANYTLTQPSSVANITTASLTVSGVTTNNKIYDGTIIATLNTESAALVGVFGTDDVTLNPKGASGSFLNKNVGTGKSVSVSGFTIGGTDSGNYTLPQQTIAGNITAAILTVSGVTANNKVYDGTISATLNTGRAILSGVLGEDIVSLVSTNATGTFVNKNIGTGNQVLISGFALDGTDATNYTLPQIFSSANITKAGLTVSGVTAINKIYDGTTTAALNTGSATLIGVIGADVVALNSTGVTGYYANKNVGTSKIISTSGFALSGTDAVNYTLTQPALTADLSPKALTITANNLIKHYKTPLTFTGTEYTTAGIIPGDPVPVFTISSPGAVASADVGKYTIMVRGGSDYNYDYTYINGMLTVNKSMLIARAEDKTKVYGSDNPQLSITYSGFYKNEDTSDLDITPIATTSALNTSEPGTYAIILTGGSDNNYDLNLVNGNLNIIKAPLTITADDKTKVYGGINPDLSITYTGFVLRQDKSVLNVLPVAETEVNLESDVGDYEINVSGASASNYSFIYNKGTFNVAKADQVITFAQIPDGLRMTQEYKLDASATSGLDISFEVSDPNLANLNGNVLTVKKDGNLTIKAMQEGDHNWNAAPDTSQSIITLPTFDDISSLFTPNNDGMNDYWYIPDLEQYGKFQVKVYNRFGQTVYQSNAYKNDWDGTWNGYPLPSASYYYIIKSSTKGYLKGVVNIAR
jgi:gliding motility-associated-like protein